MYCGYCLQGCLHKVKNGMPIGCNYNPRIGIKGIDKSRNPQKVLIAGGGPAGLSAGIFLSEKGHTVTLAEKNSVLGGQFEMAVKVPGKEAMKDPLKAMEDTAASEISRIITNTEVNADFIRKEKPDMLVWAAGAVQNIPEIKGLESQNTITSLDYFRTPEAVSGKRILVIGAGRIGLEITEKLAKEGFEVTATKRSDPVGAEMEMVTRKLILMRLDKMENVKISPHTTVKEFSEDSVIVEIDGKTENWEKFDTVILASGLLPGEKPSEEIYSMVKNVVLLGDCDHVSDIYEAVHSAYEMAEQTG
jgi:pyruvate/2-oxoglutarate dehydrogenase complex dihydrolipoamide dehydrogenase (E3) component